MQKVRRVSVSRGTPAELAAHCAGYVSSGESQWSRRHAASQATPQMAGRRPKFKGAHSLSQLIAEVAGALAHLNAQLRIEDNRERRAKLETSVDIKAAFLARLRAEQNQNGE
jgi:hypothetical protein